VTEFYVKVKVPKPPMGATHCCPERGLPWEKHIDGDVYFWNEKWEFMDSPTLSSIRVPISEVEKI
jgi:hypothetical protein